MTRFVVELKRPPNERVELIKSSDLIIFMKWFPVTFLCLIANADEVVKFKYISPSSETLMVEIRKNGNLRFDEASLLTKKELNEKLTFRNSISKENTPYLSDFTIYCRKLEGVENILEMFHDKNVEYKFFVAFGGTKLESALLRSTALREPDRITLKDGICYLNEKKFDVKNGALERFDYKILCQQNSKNIENLVLLAQRLNAIHISGTAKYSYQVVFTK